MLARNKQLHSFYINAQKIGEQKLLRFFSFHFVVYHENLKKWTRLLLKALERMEGISFTELEELFESKYSGN